MLRALPGAGEYPRSMYFRIPNSRRAVGEKVLRRNWPRRVYLRKGLVVSERTSRIHILREEADELLPCEVVHRRGTVLLSRMISAEAKSRENRLT